MAPATPISPPDGGGGKILLAVRSGREGQMAREARSNETSSRSTYWQLRQREVETYKNRLTILFTASTRICGSENTAWA